MVCFPSLIGSSCCYHKEILITKKKPSTLQIHLASHNSEKTKNYSSCVDISGAFVIVAVYKSLYKILLVLVPSLVTLHFGNAVKLPTRWQVLCHWKQEIRHLAGEISVFD